MPALQQGAAAEIDEGLFAADQVLQTYHQQAIGKHLLGGETAFSAIELVLFQGGAKQQLVTIDATVPVEDGLSGNEDIHTLNLSAESRNTGRLFGKLTNILPAIGLSADENEDSPGEKKHAKPGLDDLGCGPMMPLIPAKNNCQYNERRLAGPHQQSQDCAPCAGKCIPGSPSVRSRLHCQHNSDSYQTEKPSYPFPGQSTPKQAAVNRINESTKPVWATIFNSRR